MLKLGLKQDEVRLVDYTSQWRDAFLQTKQELINCTELEDWRIEHIGSTAIDGMRAKPIIDIVIGVDDLNKVSKDFFKALAKAGFLRLKVERPNEIILAKFTDDTFAVKTHFIHLVEYEQALWKNLLFFRDYVNTHEEAMRQYLKVKEAYTMNSSSGINEYTQYKEAFVKQIFSQRTE